MFQSEKLITLLNRMGHSESYPFSLALETALAQGVAESSRLELVQFHTAHSIMLQDIEGKPDHGGVCVEIPSTSRKDSYKQRSLNLRTPDVLPDCYNSQCKSPQIEMQQITCPGSNNAFPEAHMQHILWILLWKKSSFSEHEVPAWAGFVIMFGRSPDS